MPETLPSGSLPTGSRPDSARRCPTRSGRLSAVRGSLALSAAVLTVSVLSGCGTDAETAGAASADTYSVKTELGTFEAPTDYERVVVTSTALLDSSVAAGVTPVGSPMSFAGLPDYVGLDDGSVTRIGDSDEEIDLESVAALEPDLILMNASGGAGLGDTMFDEYSDIAPTVPVVVGEQDPKGLAAQVGAALNRTAEMDEAARAYESRAADLKAQLADDPEAAKPVSQVRLRPDEVRVMMEETNAGVAMTDAGLTFAPPAEGTSVGEGGYVETSLELLPGSLGDHIFVYSTEEGVVEEVAASPVWQAIPAVEAGNVHPVDFEAWMRGQGYLALGTVLDDIAAAYGKQLD